MTDQPAGVPPRGHQCGWCPTLLPADPDAWADHHLTVHGVNGWSVRTIRGGDWDIAELTEGDS